MSFLEECTLVNKNNFQCEKNPGQDSPTPLASEELIKTLEEKIIGLYFSAGWCPPCQKFTPLLKLFYEEQIEKGSLFEIVFVSFDQTAEAMEKYYTEDHGDWLAVKFDDEAIENLKTAYNVDSVPKLIITTSSGNVISSKGRKEIQERGGVCYRSWRSSPLLKKNATGNSPTVTIAEGTKSS